MTSDPGSSHEQDPPGTAPTSGGGGGGDPGDEGVCPSCHHRNPTNVKFCQHCGAELSQPCSECGHSNAIWAQHCGSCGVNLQQSRRARAAFQAASDHLRHKAYGDAIREAKRGLATGCMEKKLRQILHEAELSDARLRELRAEVPQLIDEGKYEESERLLLEALDLDPRAEDLRKLLTEVPGRSRGRVIDSFLETSNRALKERDLAAAMDSALRAFKLDNKDPRIVRQVQDLSAQRDRLEALYTQARVARQNKRPDEAARLCETVLADWDRADARAILQQSREALSRLGTHLRKAEALLGDGRFAAAQKEFESALAIQPTPEVLKTIEGIRATAKTRRNRLIRYGVIGTAAALILLVLVMLIVHIVGDHQTMNQAQSALDAKQYEQALKIIHDSPVPWLESARRLRIEKAATDVIGERDRLVKHPVLILLDQIARQGSKPGAIIENKLGMKLAYIPAGQFTMGSPPDEEGRASDEIQHAVHITKPFLLLTTEVTQAQWKAVTGSTPSTFSGDTLPIETVTWDDAADFCKKLSKSEGMTYRLLTEAEWEYTCRAGTTTPFSFGATLDAKQANFDGSTPYGKGPKGESRQETMAVMSFPPNPWGLYDMHGNVSEWCGDWYGPYPTGEVSDPTGPPSGTERVLRGGSWNNIAAFCRSATRSKGMPETKNNRIGFRVVMELGD